MNSKALPCLLLVLSVFVVIQIAKIESFALLAFAAAFAPTTAAHCHIFVVAADFHLFAVEHYIAVAVDACVDNSFATTGASGFYLVDGIRHFKETPGTLE